jgi:hypothetical protein
MAGSLQAIARDFLGAFMYRTSPDYAVFWGRTYIPELTYRAWAYYPFQLGVSAIGAIGLLAGLRRRLLDPSILRWLAVVLFCETLWFWVFREHSHRHVHTIDHLLVSTSLACAMSVAVIWRLTRGWRVARIGTIAAGVAVLVALMANIGVRPYGNLQVSMDWDWRRDQLDKLAGHIPGEAVLVLDLDGMDPSPEFFLDRLFVRRDGQGVTLDQAEVGAWFLLTRRTEASLRYHEALGTYGLMAVTEEFALFDPSPEPQRRAFVE